MTENLPEDVIDTLREAFRLEETGEVEAAIRLFKTAARQGSNDARSKLGTIFDDVLLPAKPDRAVYWYKQGVTGGDSSCAWNLAMHYAGRGRKRGYLYWLVRAQAMGHSDANAEMRTRGWWKKRNSGAD